MYTPTVAVEVMTVKTSPFTGWSERLACSASERLHLVRQDGGGSGSADIQRPRLASEATTQD